MDRYISRELPIPAKELPVSIPASASMKRLSPNRYTTSSKSAMPPPSAEKTGANAATANAAPKQTNGVMVEIQEAVCATTISLPNNLNKL